ncbi:hypothetical protein DNTS_033421 [Danionella cerebrum]|uniref:Uncharacterized protein n=1 Tax=Danionella cerebrum TaxID=2873325 RepID=A0A553MN08_9TELE|nr:hypothetical protein DNTS_033421 [Danionella translucida]
MNSLNGRRLLLILHISIVQHFMIGLAKLEDLAVVQGIHFVLEKLQRRGFTGQSPGDLLAHHLHDLRQNKIKSVSDIGGNGAYLVEVLLRGSHLLPRLVEQLNTDAEKLLQQSVLSEEDGVIV